MAYTKHKVNPLATMHREGLLTHVRCTCGDLLCAAAITELSASVLAEAFDKHMITVLANQYVKQFYQSTT